MRYNLFFAFFIISFYAQAQYNSTSELLKDTKIVWAARFKAAVLPFVYKPWQPTYNSSDVLTPAKFVDSQRQLTNNTFGGDLNFLIDSAFWAANPNQFFSDDSLRRATNFDSSCLVERRTIVQVTPDGEIIEGTAKQLYDYRYIGRYEIQLVVYYSLKTQRFACYMESIAPYGLKWDWETKKLGGHDKLFYFNMQAFNLEKKQDLQQSDIIQAMWCDMSVPIGKLQPIISRWDLDKVLKAYFKHLRNNRNAQKQLILPEIYQNNPTQETTYAQNYLNSIGYAQLLGETINITNPKTGKISQTVCTDKNAPLFNKENVADLIFGFDFYLNERQQFSTHCYQHNLKILDSNNNEDQDYFIHTY